jgi:hypothetical protein
MPPVGPGNHLQERDDMSIRKFNGIRWFVITLIFACTGTAVGVAGEPPLDDTPCMAESAFIKDRMQGIFRTQLAGGALNFTGEDSWFSDYPLLATVSLEAYAIDGDDIFLQQAYASIVRYFNYLFIEKDMDGDYLIESSSESYGDIPMESVAFNAMLALDMENLARISLKLGLPLRGLFWFDSTRLIKERLVSHCYDPDAGHFRSPDRQHHPKTEMYDALSLLPAFFSNIVGDNISTAMLRRYLAHPAAYSSNTGDNSPAALDGDRDASLQRVERFVHFLLIAQMLDRCGLEVQAASYRADNASPPPEADAAAAASLGVYDGFWSCWTTRSPGGSVFSELIELELLVRICATTELLSASESAALSQKLEEIKRFIDDYRVDKVNNFIGMTSDPAGALAAVRKVFQFISIARDRYRSGVYFSARDRSEIPGFDLERAYNDLVNDAVQSLHQVETMIFDAQGAERGFQLTARLLKERAVVGEMISIQISVSSNRAPERIRSVILTRGSVIDTLFSGHPFREIKPQDGTLTAEHSFRLPSDWSPGIHTLPFTIDVLMGTGERRKIYFRKSISVDPPLSFYVAFPEGNTLQQWGVPMDVHLTKRAPYAMSIQTGWFSPSGLMLKEGPSQTLYMQENQGEASLRIHVLAPNPVRPGAFPFVFKVFGNGLDIGTVSSTLYKHYQWIFVGPFEAGADALQKVYPPELHVNLLDGFKGRDGNLVWGMLPADAVSENGEIFLGDLLSSYGVGYIYTVIKSARDIRCPVTLSGTAPARLFINGEMVLEANSPSPHASPQKIAFLKEGLNNILIKVAGNENAKIYLNLGDDESLTSDEFNNNLWELVDGFKNFYERRIQQFEVASTTQKIATLRYFSHDAHSVSVIGSFNGWTPDNSSLREVSDGVWEISLHLPPGKYAYRFVVNNGRQVLDPHCPVQEADGYGGHNSVLYIK